MKKIIIAGICMGIALGMSAQEKFYNKITASYTLSPSSMTASAGSASLSFDLNFSGAGINYLAGFNIGGKNYIETGLSGTYLWSNDSVELAGEKSDFDFKHYSLTIPVNYTYRFAFKDGDLHLAPFAGLYARAGLGGELNGDELYGEGSDFKRLQIGGQAGVAFDVKKFYISVAYAHDFTPLAAYSRGFDADITIAPQFVFSIGVNF